MSQDYVDIPAGQSLAASLTELKDRDDAVKTQFSGAIAPTTTEAWMYWIDTTSSPNLLMQRNSADSAWVEIGDAGVANYGLLPIDGSVAMTANLDMGTNKIVNVVDPTANQDAATKKYVDDNNAGGYGSQFLTADTPTSADPVQWTLLKNGFSGSGDVTYSAGVFTVNTGISLLIQVSLRDDGGSNAATGDIQVNGTAKQQGATTNNFESFFLQWEQTFVNTDTIEIGSTQGILATQDDGFLLIVQSS